MGSKAVAASGPLSDDMQVMLLIPADVLNPRCPDEHFAGEAAAARDAGIKVALIDHDALTQPDAAEQAVARIPAGKTTLSTGAGCRTASSTPLSKRRLSSGRSSCAPPPRPTTVPMNCQSGNPALACLTPLSVWTSGDNRDAFEQAGQKLGPGPAVVPDYTRPMKHYWNEAAFIPDLGDATAAWQVASRFRQLRDDDFAGGFVLRHFKHFTSAEVRTWWVNGACALTTAHPDTPDDQPPDDFIPGSLAAVIAAFKLPFVTVDFALRDDGAWRVIELGDGQISDPAGLHPTTRPDRLTPDQPTVNPNSRNSPDDAVRSQADDAPCHIDRLQNMWMPFCPAATSRAPPAEG